MSEAAAVPPPATRLDLDQPAHPLAYLGILGVLAAGLVYVGHSVLSDAQVAGEAITWLPFLLLFVSLVIALGFEFVNGFHDTANAVATVIYTRALPAPIAVMWSGLFNFLGVLVSSGGVAFGIVSLLPVELILQVGSAAGFAMVFALLIAAIIWNLGTWYLGLPASSSHTLVGSIIGVGVANAMMRGRDGTSGVDWSKAREVGESLLFSPLVGFAIAALLLFLVRHLIRIPALFAEPRGDAPPPLWIRALLILTCTSVSFAHGSNDGQKGMGLIMLIMIGTLPTAYALNRALPDGEIAAFHDASRAAVTVVGRAAGGAAAPGDARSIIMDYVSRHNFTGSTYPALSSVVQNISEDIEKYGTLARIPAAAVGNTRNDMYLVSEAIRFLMKDNESGLAKEEVAALTRYKEMLDRATKFIPLWVKIAVAIALGLGTMVGWKRIVVTVGEKIGKTHLSYAQGGAAEIVAAATIQTADLYNLPVSTTHVLSSGIAGTMAANGSGLQLSTIRNIVLGWVLTLPAAIVLSGTLYWIFSHIF